MQTVSVQIQDGYMPNFLNYVDDNEPNIIVEDENLKHDPYFYERKEELAQLIDDCESGKMEMLSQEQYDKEMEIFFKDLKANENI